MFVFHETHKVGCEISDQLTTITGRIHADTRLLGSNVGWFVQPSLKFFQILIQSNPFCISIEFQGHSLSAYDVFIKYSF